jgi:peroxiredoxin
LIKKFPLFHEKGLHIVAVFQSPPESIHKYVGRQNPPFPVVPDPDHILYNTYAVENSWWSFLKSGIRIPDMVSAGAKGFLPGRIEGKVNMVPADFLIGPDQVVAKAYYGKDIGDHLPIDEIAQWLSGNA